MVVVLNSNSFGFVFICFRHTSDLSAVCAYRMSDISKVFSEGKYKTQASVETSFIKWVIFSGEVPAPRPGAVSLPFIQNVCWSVWSEAESQCVAVFFFLWVAPAESQFLLNSWLCCAPFPPLLAFLLHQCINDEARSLGITKTLQLPDKTLQFIRDKPLMDQAIEPMGGRPLLSRRGATFTQIIVNQVQALNGDKYNVMFIGTGVWLCPPPVCISV